MLPSVSISPDNGNVGTSVSVKGTGFGDAEDEIKILYDDSSVKTGIQADSGGSWSGTFTAPDSHGGSHTVGASGSSTSASDVAEVDFTIKPTISVSPSSCGGVGCAITVKGQGFGDGEANIQVIFDGSSVKTGITADSKGVWSATFNVPSTFSGTHSIDASGSSTDASDIENVSFTVLSGIGIDKASAYVGDVVNVTGTGFNENENNIYITFDGVNQGDRISADSKGEWKTSLTVPSAVNGPHKIDAHGSETSAGGIEDQTLTILAKITLSPTGGNVGDSVTINGSGFSGGKTVAVMFGKVSVLNDISIDSSGSFSENFEAPKGAGGNIDVMAKDTSNVSATAVFAMDKTAPSTPEIKSPAKDARVGFIGKTKVNFTWTAVTDPSGVYYAFQVAKDSDFKDIVFEHSDLTSVEYKSEDTEALPQGEYYWRARAVDGANNASDWTPSTPFKAGGMSATTLTIIIVAAVLVIAVIVLRVRAISKR